MRNSILLWIENLLRNREKIIYRKLIKSRYKRLVIYGTGDIGRAVKSLIDEGDANLNVLFWVDIKAYNQADLTVDELAVKTIHELAAVPDDCAVVLATKASVQDMSFYCHKYQIPSERQVY